MKVTDKRGFCYTVVVKHYPKNGISIAYYDDYRIAAREYGCCRPPMSDDDREWEYYQQRLDDIETDLNTMCVEYFTKTRRRNQPKSETT